jgi:primosomal protein N' (replication factor Y)
VAYVHHEQQQQKRRKEEEQTLFEVDHHAKGVMVCHHCGGTASMPEACGRCGSRSLRLAGIGTQKVVSELRARLPGLRVLRMDGDTVSREKEDEEGAYESFLSGKADVLVGTKLVAKGFHFPRVTLVGVVDADTMLSMPDFRCAERTVQLLVQAAGRAGRAERPGEVLLQTSQPTHYAIQAVARGDYASFARREMGLRRELGYPPASRLLRLLFSGRKDEAVRDAAEDAAQALREGLGPSEEVLGPAPGLYAKLQGSFRHHLLIKAGDEGRLSAVIEKVRRLRMPSGVKLKANVDPYDFF